MAKPRKKPSYTALLTEVRTLRKVVQSAKVTAEEHYLGSYQFGSEMTVRLRTAFRLNFDTLVIQDDYSSSDASAFIIRACRTKEASRV
jgi:hypothetical protein